MPVLLNSESGMFCELFELNVPKNEESTAIKDFAVHASQFVDHVEVVSATVQYTTNPRNIRNKGLSLRYGRRKGYRLVDAFCDVTSFTPAPICKKRMHWSTVIKSRDKDSQVFRGKLGDAIRTPKKTKSLMHQEDSNDMGYVTVQLYRDERKRPEDKWIEFIINFTAGVIERKPTQSPIQTLSSAPRTRNSEDLSIGSLSSSSGSLQLSNLRDMPIETSDHAATSPVFSSDGVSKVPTASTSRPGPFKRKSEDVSPTQTIGENVVRVHKHKRVCGIAKSWKPSLIMVSETTKTNEVVARSGSWGLPRLCSSNSAVALDWGRVESDEEVFTSLSSSEDGSDSETHADLKKLKQTTKALEGAIAEERRQERSRQE